MDSELSALVAAYEALSGLGPAERTRVVRWLAEKFDADAGVGKSGTPLQDRFVVAAREAPSLELSIGSGHEKDNLRPRSQRTVEASLEKDPSTRSTKLIAEGATVTPRDFVSTKKPRSDVQKVAVLAYYLTLYRSMPHFDTRAIAALAEEAGLPAFRNATSAVSNAQSQLGYLVNAGQRGARKLSEAGVDLVESLPKTAKHRRSLNTKDTARRTASGDMSNERSAARASSKDYGRSVEFSAHAGNDRNT